ncbi:MAG: hypothetical protein ACLPYB_08430 [Desulfobaccales bacterium]
MSRVRRQWLVIICLAFLVLGPNYGAAAEIFGNYKLQDKVGLHELMVSKWHQPGSIKFNIRVQIDAENRFGGMSGVADLKGNTATYSDKDCPLTITFQGNKAVVHASQCRDRFGPLPFDGVYLKK